VEVGAEDEEVLVIVDNVVGGEEGVVGPPPTDASWNRAMLSGKTSILLLYNAREFPF
jgi:hypothetical protein